MGEQSLALGLLRVRIAGLLFVSGKACPRKIVGLVSGEVCIEGLRLFKSSEQPLMGWQSLAILIRLLSCSV